MSQSWQPNALIANLIKRASILNKIRQFFNDRKLLEVETPSLSQATVTDSHIMPFKTYFIEQTTINNTEFYLITSPEYHMKRLLAAGSGPIFQLCRSFRNQEVGRYHNPEFTMLEWYRPHYNMYNMMEEVNDFLKHILNCDSAEKISYQKAFIHYVGLDPLLEDHSHLYKAIMRWNLDDIISEEDDKDTLLQLLFMTAVEPHIGHDKPTFIYHFPSSQAALAKINTKDFRIAERFEVYFKGVELANGFHELTDVEEQRQRFEQDNKKRSFMKLTKQSIDENFLAAMMHGIPECSGVAVGIDRLVMLALQVNCLSEVMSFTIERA